MGITLSDGHSQCFGFFDSACCCPYFFFFTHAKGKWLLNGNLFYEACRRFLIRLFCFIRHHHRLSLSHQTNHLKVTTRQNSKYLNKLIRCLDVYFYVDLVAFGLLCNLQRNHIGEEDISMLH